jgi:periplasmic protein TonB
MKRLARLCVSAGLACALAVTIAAQEKIYRQGDDGITLPRIIRQVKPQYTKEAKEARIQGEVVVAAVVKDDGKVGEVTVTKSLDTVYGLDEEAVNAVKQWLFSPGTKDDKPVAVRVEIELTFTLK